MPKPEWPSSSSSRVGTIRDGATPPSDICHQSTTNGASYPSLAQIHNHPRNRGNSIEAVAAELGRPGTVLADNGYANGAAVAGLEASGIEALVATAAEGRRRRHDFRPTGAGRAAKEAKADWLREMATKLDSEEGRALYRLRQQTVEPVFGVIKAVLGFTGFSLRGLDKVAGEWNLVALAYNCKRLHKLTLSMAS